MSSRRRILRGVGSLLAVLGVLLVALTVVLSFAGPRNHLLAVAMGRVLHRLPGEVTVERAAWPSLGELQIDGLGWVVRDSVLVEQANLHVRVDLSELRHRDLHILELIVDAAHVDIPKLRHALATISDAADGSEDRVKDRAAAAGSEKQDAGRGFPRPGVWAPVPSLAIDSLSVSLEEIILSDSLSVEIEVVGRLNLLSGVEPELDFETIRVADSRGWPRLAGGELTLLSQKLFGEFRIEPMEDWPFKLRLESSEMNQLALNLHEIRLPVPWGDPLSLDLNCQFQHDGLTLQTLSADGTVSTPTLDRLSRRPGLEAIAEIGQMGALRSEFRVDAVLGGDPEIGVLWEIEEEGGPHGLVGRIQVDLWGDLSAPRVDLDLQIGTGSSGEQNSLPFERIAISAHTERAGSTAVSVAADVSLLGAQPVVVQLRAEAEQETSAWLVRLEPIRIEARPDPTALSESSRQAQWSRATAERREWLWSHSDNSSLAGLVRYENSGDLTLRQFRIAGDFGDLYVQGSLDSEQRGRLEVRGEWGTVPQILLAGLPSDPVLQRQIRNDWKQRGPFFVDGTVHLNPNPSANPSANANANADLNANADPSFSADVDFDFFLPGPRTFRALFPEAMQSDSLGPGRGHVHAEVANADWSARVNLQGRGWLEKSHLSLGGHAGHTRIDSASVRLPGLDLFMSGEQDSAYVDYRASVVVDTLALLSTLGFAVPDYEGINLQANATWTGHPLAAALEFDLSGEFLSAGLRVPRILGSGQWSQRGTEVSVTLPEGLVSPSVALDDVRVSFSGWGDGVQKGQFEVSARGPDLEVLHVASIAQDSTEWIVETDSLRLALQGQSIENETPFRVVYGGDGERIEVTGFAMRGDLGSIRAQGTTSAENVDFLIQASLELPAEPSSVDLPPGMWPRKVELDLEAKGPTDLVFSGRIRGLSLPGQEDLVATLTARSEEGGVVVDAALFPAGDAVAEDQRLLQGHGRIPIRVGVYPPTVSIEPGEIDLRLETWNLPVSLFPEETLGDDRHVGLVSSFLEVLGRTDSPKIEARGQLSFPDWEEMNVYLLGFEGAYEHSAEGIESRLWITREGVDQVNGVASLPVTISLHPYRAEWVEDEEITASLQSTTLDLEDFNPLLGGTYTIEGRCRFDLSANGNPLDPSLSGQFESDQLRIRGPAGSQLGGSSTLSLAGTGRRPKLNGQVSVTNGVLVLPETPKDLLPAQGSARLWALSDSLGEEAGELDEVGELDEAGEVVPAHNIAASDTSARSQIRPILDLVVEIPGSFWIRGGGLEVELAGRLDVKDRGVPVVNGNLQAKEGHLTLLGRYFEVEKGTVGFYGEEEIDPVLDLSLSTRISDTSIYVDVTGRASEPRLALRSEPEMPEGDILSFLVLGRRIDELDQDQMGLLRSRATDIAAAFGTAQLGQRVAGQLGIDLVSVQQSSESEGGSSLVFGKYLSPRVLLKYEQALGEGKGWLVNLEYLLTEHLRLESLYGQQSQSGAEINWINEY